MESHISYTQNYDISINSINIKNSQKGYDSTIAPFFRPYEDLDVNNIESESIIPERDLTNIDTINIFTKICEDKTVQDFYINNNGIDREIYIKEWILFSIEKILSLDEMYKLSNINNIIDLGYVYHGMGWVVVAFYYLPEKKIYFRMDGGSNGHDRMDNFNKLKNIDKLLENDKKGIDFPIFINKIQNDFNIPNNIV
jgi:hypothetical protein